MQSLGGQFKSFLYRFYRQLITLRNSFNSAARSEQSQSMPNIDTRIFESWAASTYFRRADDVPSNWIIFIRLATHHFTHEFSLPFRRNGHFTAIAATAQRGAGGLGFLCCVSLIHVSIHPSQELGAQPLQLLPDGAIQNLAVDVEHDAAEQRRVNLVLQLDLFVQAF